MYYKYIFSITIKYINIFVLLICMDITEITPQISEICGIHVGDGYLRNKDHRKELDISGSIEEEEYYDNRVIPLFEEVFKITIKGRFFPHRNTYGFVIRDLKIIEFMHKLGFPYGKKTLTVKIPRSILKTNNKQIIRSFLRGFFDTDGSISFKKSYGNYKYFKRTYHYYPRITFSTVSRPLVKDLILLLNKLNINFYKVLYKHKNNELWNKSFKFYICGVKSLNRWVKEVGFRNHCKYSRYLIWKKFGFCPSNTTYKQRKDILIGKLDPYLFYKGL